MTASILARAVLRIAMLLFAFDTFIKRVEFYGFQQKIVMDSINRFVRPGRHVLKAWSKVNGRDL